MAKLGIFASILTICAALGFATISSSPVQAAGECKRTTFQTKLVSEACKSGGPKAAKDAMKAVLKTAKEKKVEGVTGCPSCHSKVGADYPLKKDGLDLFKKAGGELLENKAVTAPVTPAPVAPKQTK